MKKTVFSFIALLLPILASAYDKFEHDGIYYFLSPDDKTATVAPADTIGYYSGNVVVPEEIVSNGETYRVTSIGSAFICCQKLISVTIPNSVTFIHDCAFSLCNNLTSVTIGSGVTSIGVRAFDHCSSLTSINIPNSAVTSIGELAFLDCSSLTSIDIPNSVTSIGYAAFLNCSSLTSITIGSGVTSINERVFYGTGWYNNQSNGVLYLNKWLVGYKGDRPSGDLVIKEGTKGIAIGAFHCCSGLTSLTIPNTVIYINEYAFSECCGITSMTIGSGVTSIGQYAFYGCNKIATPLILPNGLTSIGRAAFQYGRSLPSVELPNSLTEINMQAFSFCDEIQSVTSHITNPFPITNDVFTENTDTFSKATLYVPKGTEGLYANTDGWKEFMNIETMEKDKTSADVNGDGVVNAADIVTIVNLIMKGK